MGHLTNAKNKFPAFCIGDVVRHRLYPFRGVIVDVDPEFDNTEEWYASIPEDVRPAREQPFYYLLAENSETYTRPMSRSKICCPIRKMALSLFDDVFDRYKTSFYSRGCRACVPAAQVGR